MTQQQRDELFYKNYKLALILINPWLNKVDEDKKEDVIQEGMIGFMKAVEKWDSKLGSLSTYSKFWVDQMIMRFLYEDKMIHIPINVASAINRIDGIWGKECTGEHKKSFRQIVAENGISYGQYKAGKIEAVSLDNLFMKDANDKERELAFESDDSIYDELHDKELKKKIDEVLDMLPEREQYVLIRRFGLHDSEEMSLSEVGAELDLTRERIRQIEVKALRRIRYYNDKKNLRLEEFNIQKKGNNEMLRKV